MTQLSLVPPDVSRLKGESGIVIPPLSDLYIEPPFKVITGRNRANVSKEEWWSTVEPRHNLDAFFSAYLTTSPAAFTNPLLVLGHPGSGKSSLTRVLAARLPESRYVPVRVELRRVSPRNTIEMQVEEGLSVLLGRNTTWQYFRQTTKRIPVIFLDGLDELIQASEEKQTDYLEQVQLFQQRELVYGGAYVIVTSRTVVADHARIPPDAIVLKIDDFGGPEILAFTESWNRLNSRYFEEVDMRPFPIELPEEVVQLAGQPLLLLLLALLDADGNALQSEGRTRTKASTYRQILTTFIGREMLKHAPQTTQEELARLTNGELLKLAYVALGMFNRGAQLLNARQVGEDLQSLAPEPHGPERMDQVYKLLGRFFFVHQAQSNSPEGVQNAYEFLHSTFGEYLVAHLAHEVFTDVLDDSARSSRSRFAGARNIDQWASTLFAFQPFTQRSQILEFFAELTEEEAVGGTALSDLLIALAVGHLEAGAGEMGQSSPYRPTELHLTGKLAAYTCNLILLACCIPTDDENRTGTRRTAFHATAKWDSLVHLWKSQLDSSAWEELSQMLWARSARRVLFDVDRVVDEVEIGLEFLAPATSSQYHLTPAMNCIGKPAPDVRMVISLMASEEKTRKIISGDTVFAPRGLVSEDVRVHFLASKDIRLVFDADDLLMQLLNPDLALIPNELVEPGLQHLLRSPLCGEWLVRHLRVIVESPLADHFQPATFEQLVKVVQENLPRDLGLVASLIDVLVDADISASAYELFHTVAPFSQREQFLAAHPGFALRVAVAFAKAGYHDDPDTSDWAARVSKVPLTSLYEQDVTAPILAVTLARKHHFLPWATSRGIVEASALPGTVLRRMSIEDALFLIRCGARDPLRGLQKVLGFGKAWADAHRGVREGRITRLADAIRRLPDSSGTSIRAVLDVLN